MATARMGTPNQSQVSPCEIVVQLLLISSTAKRRCRPTLGNPDDRDADGMLIDVDVQSIDDATALSNEEKWWDIDEFFKAAVTRCVEGKSQKYHACKICS